ncbi:MAG TPA: nucleotide exchange factor GrpE, partial [Candidatus Paceibacterota bacterium]|nr:nucleotide exchange factor GrpE [Candidatus Paceibacterota bacterium]
EEEDGAGDVVKKLREKLKKCVEEKQEYLDGWQRSKADFVNVKKKDEELRAGLMSFAKEGIILDILSSVDNFEMAFADKKVWESVDKNWRVGIEYIHSQLLKTLKEHGLEQFDPNGEQFDPNRHDSVESVVTDKKEEDHKVLEVMQRGYILNGKIIRPAKVKVGQLKI